MSGAPLISCLMVTADRPEFCRRAIRCFQNQTYPAKELVIVDDGETDLRPLFRDLPAGEVNYIKLQPSSSAALGKLRNVAIDNANGELAAQWDDDDWYHPERLFTQFSKLDDNADACVLAGSLMHLNDSRFFYHPYIGLLKGGVPGTILHRLSREHRYPEQRRAEDTAFLKLWEEDGGVNILPVSYAHLFIRCFHGDNTWEKEHFVRRIRNSPGALALYGWHKYIRGNVFGHPRFQLDDAARESFEMYLQDSQELQLLEAPAPA